MKININKLVVALMVLLLTQFNASASSHREAPLISNDPMADNTDLYAFRSPANPNNIVIIADYIPFEHPAGGPNWYTFGENIRYEIHIKNNAATTGDDITYRFTFTHTNQDASTFFNIRLGKQNILTTYTCERSFDNGTTWAAIKINGVVAPPNIGPRSINGPVGLNESGGYEDLMMAAVTTASTGEKLFCGPIDDPFFVDLGGAFDVGGFRTAGRDGLAKFNCHSIALEIPISSLQKDGLTTASATNILDPNFVIGVWASASRRTITTLDTAGHDNVSGTWVQVSRLGMPLTNEVIIPIGEKDRWNSINPYTGDTAYEKYFSNPELGLYLNNEAYGAAVPGLAALNIQTNSLGMFDFRNGAAGLYGLKYTPAVVGTALDPSVFGNFLLPNSTSPRAVDILPIFFTGVPNLDPYQLATGKGGNPLAAGKPFINNFMPTFSDMLRLNMAVPVTDRTSSDFSSLGIIKAAALGLTDSRFDSTTDIQFIPNMDGFPNGRRLEDDVTTIELQAVSGVALAAIGLWYDDYIPGTTASPVTPTLVSVLSFNAGVTHNDTTFRVAFPYVQQPWPGFRGDSYSSPLGVSTLAMNTPLAAMAAYPNPFTNQLSFRYNVATQGIVTIQVTDINGREVSTINEGNKPAGEFIAKWNGNVAAGTYFATMYVGSTKTQTVKVIKAN